MITIPFHVKRLAKHFFAANHELYIVGGSVRDMLLNRKIMDYDFATSATPAEMQALFSRVIPTGIKHGTVTIYEKKHHYEITTYRTEGAYTDKRHPDSVQFIRSLPKDLARRDFTINAIALHPLTQKIYDPYQGQKDLQAKCIRSVGSPQDRFAEDALRMLRGIRLAAALNFSLHDAVYTAIQKHASDITSVAPERTAQELEKIMSAQKPSIGWKFLKETTLLRFIIPELEEDEKKSNIPKVFPHLLQACDCVPQSNTDLRWAALLHDVAKPRCALFTENGWHFHGHDKESAKIAITILRRLRMSNVRIKTVAHLIRHHMFSYTSEWSDAAVRRFVNRVGLPMIDALIALRIADYCGKTEKIQIQYHVKELEKRIHTMREKNEAISYKELAVNGNDLQRELKLKQSPYIGVLLKELLEAVLSDAELNTYPQLITIAKRITQNKKH